jgi:hypothetical protein
MNTSTPVEPKTVPNRIGYARVSSIGQNLDSQMDSLKQAGCIKIFTDKLTGSRMEQPGWEELLKSMTSKSLKRTCTFLARWAILANFGLVFCPRLGRIRIMFAKNDQPIQNIALLGESLKYDPVSGFRSNLHSKP